jgi:hypothetical protein
MSEKSFATTPCSCHDEIHDEPGPVKSRLENFTIASGNIGSGSKDFEGIHVPSELVSDYKISALSPVIFPSHLNVINLCTGRPLGTPLYRFFDLLTAALEERLHPAVVKVLDPTAEAKFVRNLMRKGPKENPLDPSSNEEMRSRRCHGNILIVRTSAIAGGEYGEKPFIAIPADVDNPRENIQSALMKYEFLLHVHFHYSIAFQKVLSRIRLLPIKRCAFRES